MASSLMCKSNFFQYQGNCISTYEFTGWSREQKLDWARTCGTDWPCVADSAAEEEKVVVPKSIGDGRVLTGVAPVLPQVHRLLREDPNWTFRGPKINGPVSGYTGKLVVVDKSVSRHTN
eukprot:Gregarina_sp_Poly_1__2808@NODE_1780_length_3344_cov_71_803784_g1158_i0_p3_GENE_NODE_1780_length_3344_cov_71_803784_g1158_i0NODE_1780_length_3344_cov_71_803784_g1158_i0_p3_ORF_typecomplete_len119_score15_51CPW_WPC/PF09717_10/5_6e07Sclerostin/PF05463_11/0_055_NODE_1780_length_3344_cov_71_803784_g1158_i012761632